MKVTVSFNTVKIVVPCGDGELTVRDLTQLATTRYVVARNDDPTFIFAISPPWFAK